LDPPPAREFLRSHRRSNIHLYPEDWKKLPIPDVSTAQQKPIITLVDRILNAKRADLHADLSTLEAGLDSRVAALYGLKPKQARLLPQSARSSERPDEQVA